MQFIFHVLTKSKIHVVSLIDKEYSIKQQTVNECLLQFLFIVKIIQ